MANREQALVVEDEPDVRDGIADLLASEGYAVTTARNGREALERAHSSRPDIVLLDLMMPVMDGWHFMTELYNDDQLRDVPVVVISAHPHPPRGVPVLQKPFTAEALLSTMHGVLATAHRC